MPPECFRIQGAETLRYPKIPYHSNAFRHGYAVIEIIIALNNHKCQ